MGEVNLGQIRPGMEVYDPDCRLLGKVTEVYANPPDLGLSGATPYFRAEESELGMGKIWDIPFSEVLNVEGDKITAEINPDMVANPDQQPVPDFPGKQRPYQGQPQAE